MKLGESTGGRPPYEPDSADLERVQKLAKHGYSKKAIAKAMDIEEKTLYNIEDRNDAFLQCIKNGIVDYCIKVEDMVISGDISPTQYIYWSRTKWKHFYPQEEKQVVDYQNRPDINVTFTNKPEPVVASVQSDTTEKTSDDATDSA